MPSKPKKKRRIRWGRLVLPVILILLIIGFVYVRSQLKAPGTNEEKTVEVTQGESLESILQNMQDLGLIRNAAIARLYAQTHDVSWYVGTYTISSDMDVKEILEFLSNASNAKTDYVAVTIPEGTWAKEIASILSESFPYTQQQFLDKWNDQAYIQQLAQEYTFLNPSILDDPDIKVKLEGYLFPETYYIDSDAGIDTITRTFLDQFEKIYEQYKSEFDSSKLSVEELVTLASIIQFEASDVQDMKTIAGVFYNRLADGMDLQSSVTVCYALYDQFNEPEDCETQWDIDSPYNTYLNAGLPPSPILNPGLDAIVAALEPEDNDYLYFAADIYNVLSNPGKVYYSRTYEEHEKIVQELNLVIE